MHVTKIVYSKRSYVALNFDIVFVSTFYLNRANMRFKLIILLTTLRSALGGPFLFPNLIPLHKLFEVRKEQSTPVLFNHTT